MLAVVYLRVSTESQLDGYGLDAQESKVREYCAQNNITIDRIFREEGTSGKNELEDRVALVQLNEYVASNKITVIIIPELSRLARDLMIQERILNEWQSRGITVFSTKEPDLNGNDPTRRFIRQVLGAVNEYDRAMIVARMKAGRIAKARTGQHAVGKIPLGYKSVDVDGRRQLIVDDDSADTVRLIFKLHAKGLSLQNIADHLNASHIQPPRSDKWAKTTIKSILDNPKYRGIMQYRENGELLADTINNDLKVIR